MPDTARQTGRNQEVVGRKLVRADAHARQLSVWCACEIHPPTHPPRNRPTALMCESQWGICMRMCDVTLTFPQIKGRGPILSSVGIVEIPNRNLAATLAGNLILDHIEQVVENREASGKTIPNATIPAFGINWQPGIMGKCKLKRFGDICLTVKNSEASAATYQRIADLWGNCFYSESTFPENGVAKSVITLPTRSRTRS